MSDTRRRKELFEKLMHSKDFRDVFFELIGTLQQDLGSYLDPRDPYDPNSGDWEMSASPATVLIGDARTEVARLVNKKGDTDSLTAVVRVFPPQDGTYPLPGGGQVTATTDPTNPFNSQTVSALLSAPNNALPGNIQQTIEVIGEIALGNQHMNFSLPFNIPLGQIVRLNNVASAMVVNARLACRYYQKFGSGSIFSWFVAANGSNFARNVAFDNLPPLSQGITVGSPQPTVQMQGYIGRGITLPVPPQRIFYGWIDTGVVQNTQHLCPVARGAQTVLLLSDASAANNDPGAGGAFQGVTLLFNQICQSPGAATTRRVLNFPANTTIPLRSDCVAIEVVNQAAPATAIPFELQYDLGF